MYTKHFFKMLIGLGVMIALGIIGLFIINSYHKESIKGGVSPVSGFGQ